MKNKDGITLIVLIITIIALIILAGVSISLAIGENGVISRAIKTREKALYVTEKEYLELNVASVQLNNRKENISSAKLGEELNTRNLAHSYNWHIIKVNDNIYETGWYYLGKGTDLQDYGKTKYNWLINYETGEIIELKEDDYISLSVGDMLAVKDSLIINVDSSIIDESIGSDEEALEKQLGEGVDLKNFDYNEKSGLTSTSFNFDGIDDYIQVEYSNKKQKEALINNGFTFEYYGTMSGGTSYKNPGFGGDFEKYTHYKGLFCFWNGDDKFQADLRFGLARRWKYYKVECWYSS